MSRYRLLQVFLFRFYLAWTLLAWRGPARTEAHGPSDVPPTTPSPIIPEAARWRLEQRYRLFSDLCHRCPTRLQSPTLAKAEAIYQLLHGFRRQAPPASEVNAVDAESERHYERLCREYPVARVHWDGRQMAMRAMARVELARGIARHVLVEIENGSPGPLQVSIRRRGGLADIAPPQTAPPKERLAWIVPLVETSLTTTEIGLDLFDAVSTRRVANMTLPVAVAEPARLTGTLTDEETGRLGPACVRVECGDGELRHGKAFERNATLSEKPVVFRPAWYKLPFFYSDGRFEIEVPAGRTVVTVQRGFETLPVEEVFQLRPGGHRAVAIRFRRFLDMKQLGWISGDTHIHWATNRWDENEDLGLLGMVQRAEDLRVANNLTLYQWRDSKNGGPFIKPNQAPVGPIAAHSDGDFHMQMAEEYRNDDHYGHLNLLGITRLITPLATGPGSGGPPEAFDYPINRTAILETRRQGGLSVEAHNLGPVCCSDVPVNVALGLSDSLDQLEPEHYYRFLNSGFHIGLTNGSDHPARVVGCARAYVRIDGPFTYARWLAGVRRGRTFVTSGPLLFLKVNGAEVGDAIPAAREAPCHVDVRAISRFPLGTLQIVSNGEVLRTVTIPEREARLRFDVPADGSRWFVARVSRSGIYDCLAAPDVAHTSAVYVQVGGRDVIRRESVQGWIENVRQHAERVRTLARFATESQRQEALQHIAEGLAKYEQLLAQADRQKRD